MNGLKEFTAPEMEKVRKAHTMFIVQAIVCCLILLPIGVIIAMCMRWSKIDSMGEELHDKVVQYCHENRAPFYAKGIRPRPGICGCYIVFECVLVRQDDK